MSAVRQYPLPLAHRPALDAADFLVADGNRTAVEWLDRWPDWPHPVVIVVGPEGSGKTHLARVFARRAGAMTLDGGTLDAGRVATLAAAVPAAVVVDDADAVVDHEALLHLHNLLAQRDGQLLLTARSAPARWPIALADLGSRLRAAPIAAIEAPDDALLAAVIGKLFSDRGVAVDPEVVGYVAARIERSFAAAQRVVAALDARALAAGRRLSLPLVRAALADLPNDAEHIEEG